MSTHYRGSAREVRALDAFIKLIRATETVNTWIHRGLNELGLTQAQLAVLEALLHRGPMSQRELGRKLLRSDANVTTVIDNLERSGRIRRDRNVDDRRVVTVSLTSAGRRVIERMFPSHVRRISTALSVLTTAEQDELARLCRKLGLRIAEDPPDQHGADAAGTDSRPAAVGSRHVASRRASAKGRAASDGRVSARVDRTRRRTGTGMRSATTATKADTTAAAKTGTRLARGVQGTDDGGGTSPRRRGRR